MTVKLESRLNKLRSVSSETVLMMYVNDWHTDSSNIRHYMSYSIVRILTRPLFALAANGLMQIARNKGLHSCLPLRWSHMAFCGISLLVVIHFALCTDELKVKKSHAARLALQ